jgi:inosine-uridine nucleoside N-ribohydrolase
LNSAADGISPLTGAQLVAAKVSTLWIMGGDFPNGTSNNFDRDANARTSAANVVSSWPGPIIFIGHEIGTDVISGGNLQGMQGTDVLAQALLDMGSPTGRSSWDPMAMMAAIAGDVTDWGMSLVRGTATVNPSTGANTWVNSGSGNHYYAVRDGSISAEQYASIINTLLLRSNWETFDPLP